MPELAVLRQQSMPTGLGEGGHDEREVMPGRGVQLGGFIVTLLGIGEDGDRYATLSSGLRHWAGAIAEACGLGVVVGRDSGIVWGRAPMLMPRPSLYPVPNASSRAAPPSTYHNCQYNQKES